MKTALAYKLDISGVWHECPESENLIAHDPTNLAYTMMRSIYDDFNVVITILELTCLNRDKSKPNRFA